MKQIKVIDSHTGGEPTRIIVEGGPDLGPGALLERRAIFRDQFDDVRSAVVNEPRGSDVLVGGLLCDPVDTTCSAGVIFFNNASYLGMCGHGTIGLMVTLHHMGRIETGRHKIETPVGIVTAELSDNGNVSLVNIPSYRIQADISVEVPNYGTVVGDIAWGGNWFFLVTNSTETLTLDRVDDLRDLTLKIRDALDAAGITGPGGEYLDHIELFGPPVNANNHSRNYVMCPGGAYDRSPCGTGMSAKLACLAADEKLAAGELWRQESIVGSVFECSYQPADEPNQIIPTIRGSAFVSGEATLILNPSDPFCMGIRT